jgi:hypothetical protein
MQITLSQGLSTKQTGVGTITPNSGEYGDQLITQLQARYYEWAYRGKLWTLSSAYGGAVLVAASAIGQTAWAPSVGLYNGSSGTSAVNLVIISGTVALVSGTAASGGIVWGYCPPPAGVSAAGGNGAINCGTFVAGGSVAKTFIASAMTGSVASVMLEPFQTNAFAGAVGATTANTAAYQDVGGRFIVPPGGAIGITGTVGTSLTLQSAISWIELPV